jgi:hypothetical protein
MSPPHVAAPDAPASGTDAGGVGDAGTASFAAPGAVCALGWTAGRLVCDSEGGLTGVVL